MDLIQFSIDYFKKFVNWLRTSCTISITVVGLCLKKTDRYEYDILA